MALTPEDVVNKQFQQTKFREGYDQDEVDDFLDEVVVELRRLIQENQDLKEQVSKAESSSAASGDNGSKTDFVAQQQAPATPAPVPAAPASTEAPAQAAAESGDESESSNSLLVLARRLHDEHVREGSEKRDQLIAEGHATAARVVSEAEAKQREELSKLETAKSGLEKKIDELRVFEREYRTNLRSYIEGHLKDLDKASPSNGSSQLSSSTSN
ncbi:DivIVA domain-containing protein [Paramicrobacterium agarici]|uniref:Cell wall synthesis protein Wag31 n=1 Tax=Paramicrobacterium agarici TaxID=630514 RepID=A0A2A9DZ96_9MICO|nr:DivIVA domain-containing protein [Microbacterium agarici]PFG31445.1 DivIVA domain-containing protein [Microbacterium agarici]TQO21333.1 DivIVA domain-containing protein [Microbacterium agarici]